MKNRGGREGDKREEEREKEEQEEEREGRTKTVKCKIRHHSHHILINIIAIQFERAHYKPPLQRLLSSARAVNKINITLPFKPGAYSRVAMALI